jgi:outer membrane autotransporter protein
VAIGGDGEIGPGLRLGASLGTSATEEEVAGDVSEALAEGVLATVYTTINKGRGFISAAAGGGYQRLDLSRLASIGSALATAEAETDGWVMQGSLQAGMLFELDGGMTVSPKASAAYVHQWIESYSESGAGAGNVSIEDHDTGALRLKVQVEAGRSFELSGMGVDPRASLGIVSDLSDGGFAAGSFSNTGLTFDLALNDRNSVRAVGGAGVGLTLLNGITANLAYDGEFSDRSTAHAVSGGFQIVW